MSKEKVSEAQDLENKKKAELLMSDVKARILLKQPFYGVLLSMTNFVSDDVVPTMATDGVRIYFNPKYVLSLSDVERLAVLLHEISHCIYLHCSPERRLNRDHKRWNYATDYVVNLEIRDMGYTLPKEVLLNDKYANMNAEQVYDLLPKTDKELMALGGTLDTHIELPDGQDWDDMEDQIISAFEMTKDFYESKNHGKFPAGIKRWIEKMRKSKVKWQHIFHRFVGQALARDDYSYSRCNRRFLPQDIYLPDTRNNIIGNVVVAVDTSGSITQKILEQFTAEMAKISHLVEEVTVMTCDAEVHEVVKVRQLGDILKKVKFAGGGGTDFRPVFRRVEDSKAPPEILIYLTDSFGTFPDKAPPYPVLWCITEPEGKVPWGLSVYIPKND